MKKIIAIMITIIVLSTNTSFANKVAVTNAKSSKPKKSNAFCDSDIQNFIKANREILINDDTIKINTELKTPASVAPTSEDTKDKCLTTPPFSLDGIDLDRNYLDIVSGPADIINSMVGLGAGIIDNLKNLGGSITGAFSLGGNLFNDMCTKVVDMATSAGESYIDDFDDQYLAYDDIPYAGSVGYDLNDLRFDNNVDLDAGGAVSDIWKKNK